MDKIFIITDKVNEVEKFFNKNYSYYKSINFNQLLKNYFNINNLFGEDNKNLDKFNILVEKKEKETTNELFVEEVINRKKFNMDNFFRFISKDIKFKIENLIKDFDIIVFSINEIEELKEIENKFKNVFGIKTIKFVFDKSKLNNDKLKYLLTDFSINIPVNGDKNVLFQNIRNYIPEMAEIEQKNKPIMLVNNKFNEKQLEYIKYYQEIKNSLKNEPKFALLIQDNIKKLKNQVFLKKLDWFSEITILSIIFNKILDIKKINKDKKVIDILIEEFDLEDHQVLFYYSFNLYLIDFAIDKFLELNKNELDKIIIEVNNNNYNFYSEYQRIINKNLLNYFSIFKVLEDFFEGKYKIFDTKYDILDKLYDLI